MHPSYGSVSYLWFGKFTVTGNVIPRLSPQGGETEDAELLRVGRKDGDG